MVSSSAVAVLAGLALFLVAGVQTTAYRDDLSVSQQEFERVPLLVVVEVLLASALCLFGSLQLAGDFKPLSPFASQRGLHAQTHRPDFMSFNHRGQLLPLELPPLKGRA